MVPAAKSKNDYYVGIITALPIERAAVTAMLDELYEKPEDFDQPFQDTNCYTWGRIGLHNLVIASLAAGVYGNTMATMTATPMLFSFPNIKFGLMIGIGAGIPSPRDIRLGDVVVSQPFGISGGVFQYDLGKAKHNEWERKDFLSRPPDILLKALNRLQTEHEFQIPKAHNFLSSAITKHEYWGQSFGRPVADDFLFPSSYIHREGSFDDSCSRCDRNVVMERKQRSSQNQFKIHYGVIASGNSLVKDAQLRDWIASMDRQCVCIEMEAAGLMNNFPCLVIRGICDYADSHKNDAWQRYACATAAAFSKELLSFIPWTESRTAMKAAEVLQVPVSQLSGPPPTSQNASDQTGHHDFPQDVEFYDSTSSEYRPGMSSPQGSNPEKLLTNHIVSSQKPIVESRATQTSRSLRDVIENWKRLGVGTDHQLHMAVASGHVQAATFLISCGADIEARNEMGEGPLLLAAKRGHLDVVRLLIDRKANIEACNKDRRTSLQIVASEGRTEVVKLLIEHKANIEACNEDKLTPLHTAARKGHAEVVKLLIEHKANIEACNGDRATPLYHATKKGHLEVVKVLIEKNANVNAEGKAGGVLHVAKTGNFVAIAKLLKAHGATR